MKPTRNRVYCPSCLRSKMLFESEEKANSFIRFNSAEIMELNGKAPMRSYYCRFCGGWHITSISSEQKGQEMDQLDQDRFEKLTNGQAKVSSAELKAKAKEIRMFYNSGISALVFCRFEQAERCFSDALNLNPIHSEQIEHAQILCQRIQDQLACGVELEKTKRELLEYNALVTGLSQSDKASFERLIIEIIDNYSILQKLYSILDNAEVAIENKDYEQAKMCVEDCSSLIIHLDSEKRKLKRIVNERIQCIQSIILKHDEAHIAEKIERRAAKKRQKKTSELMRIINLIETAEKSISQNPDIAKNLLMSAGDRVRTLPPSEEKDILTQSIDRIRQTYGL